jgi:hypothetical protein
MNTIKKFLIRLLNPCYRCRWEPECKEIGYCGDNGMSFYQEIKEQSDER